VVVDSNGLIQLPKGTGLGHEIVWSRVDRATVHQEVWTT
jgi:hypothetical protein